MLQSAVVTAECCWHLLEADPAGAAAAAVSLCGGLLPGSGSPLISLIASVTSRKIQNINRPESWACACCAHPQSQDGVTQTLSCPAERVFPSPFSKISWSAQKVCMGAPSLCAESTNINYWELGEILSSSLQHVQNPLFGVCFPDGSWPTPRWIFHPTPSCPVLATTCLLSFISLIWYSVPAGFFFKNHRQNKTNVSKYIKSPVSIAIVRDFHPWVWSFVVSAFKWKWPGVDFWNFHCFLCDFIPFT